jgi:flavin-dependent dehydrogenase
MKRDVVIIGGGPAGGAAAALLARRGVDVLLIEKQARAHHKVCGEFISREAARYLAGLGIDLTALGAPVIDELMLAIGKRHWRTPLPFEGRSLSRFRLDEVLLSCAEGSGATVWRGSAATALRRETEGWRVLTGDGQDVRSAAVFLATGKHDLRDWGRPRRKGSRLIGMKMHFRPVAERSEAWRRQVGLFFFRGGYAGLEPVEDGLLNLCLLTDKNYLAAAGNAWPGLLDALRRDLPALGAGLSGASALWEKPLAVSGVPYGHIHRDDGMPGLFRLGDQMAVTPSFAGDGLAMALHSAHLAAFHYLGRKGAKACHDQARRDFLPPLRRAAVLGAALSSPLAHIPVALAHGICPGILRHIACSIRLKDGMMTDCPVNR